MLLELGSKIIVFFLSSFKAFWEATDTQVNKNMFGNLFSQNRHDWIINENELKTEKFNKMLWVLSLIRLLVDFVRSRLIEYSQQGPSDTEKPLHGAFLLW